MIQIYEVQSAAIGAGVYVCKRLDLDSSKWSSASGDRFIDAGEDPVEIFNIFENDFISGGEPALAAGDRMMAYDVTDGDGVTHYIGKPITPEIRLAKMTENAPDRDYIICNLIANNGLTEIDSGLGSGIKVYRKVPGENSDYDEINPRFENDDFLFCENIQGVWYWVQVPIPVRDGVCNGA